jgi:hypothetical protein
MPKANFDIMSMADLLAEQRWESFIELSPWEVESLSNNWGDLEIRRLVAPWEYNESRVTLADNFPPVLSTFNTERYDILANVFRSFVEGKEFFLAFFQYEDEDVNQLKLSIAYEASNGCALYKPPHQRVSVEVVGVAPIRATDLSQLEKEGWEYEDMCDDGSNYLIIPGFSGRVQGADYMNDLYLRRFMIEQFGASAYYENALTVVFRLAVLRDKPTDSLIHPPLPRL